MSPKKSAIKSESAKQKKLKAAADAAVVANDSLDASSPDARQAPGSMPDSAGSHTSLLPAAQAASGEETAD